MSHLESSSEPQSSSGADPGVMARDGAANLARTGDSSEDLIRRIGQLTRMLRDNMRELGLDREIERAAEAIPDARDPLNYVASKTEQAEIVPSMPVSGPSRCRMPWPVRRSRSAGAGTPGLPSRWPWIRRVNW